MKATYILLTFVLLLHKLQCERNFQFLISSKNLTSKNLTSTNLTSKNLKSKNVTSDQKSKLPLIRVKPQSPILEISFLKTVGSGLKSRVKREVRGYHQRSRKRSMFGTTALQTTDSLHEDFHSGPCSIQYYSKDTIVDCAWLSLRETNASWFPRNTTVLLLDQNAIETINNSSVTDLRSLRVLNLSYNNIKSIQPNAFRGLDKLETLNLEYNHLSESSYPEGLFDHLVSLIDLRLLYNSETASFPYTILDHLDQLRYLSMDAPGETFSLEKKLPNLTSLVLTGDVENLVTTSFVNVSNLVMLTLIDCFSLSNLTDTALEPLRNLTELRIEMTHIGVSKALQLLKPLVGKTMDVVEINKVSGHYIGSYNILYDNKGILNLEKTKYLIQICVRDVSLTRNNLFIIEVNAFKSKVWNQCLRSLDLSNNPLAGTKLLLLFLPTFRHLAIMNVKTSNKACFTKTSFPDGTHHSLQTVSPSLMKELTMGDHRDTPFNKCANGRRKEEQPKRQTINSVERVVESVNSKSVDLPIYQRNNIQCTDEKMSLGNGFWNGYYVLYFSKSIKYIRMSSLFNQFNLSINIHFVDAENLIYVELREFGMVSLTGRLTGANSLQTLVMTGNDLSLLAEYFFDGGCNLVELDLSNCLLDPAVMANHSARVFLNLRQLKRLDISSNLLYALQTGTFATNNLLEELDFSKNRFKNIPFNLKDTPNLKMLDLRDNSLPSLEPNEREELDKLANQHGEFNLLISGNVLSCGCESLKFLNWLATTRVSLDGDGNFTCINNEGQLSFWSVTDDLEVLWRKCSGETFLALSVIWVFFMVIGFLSVFLIWKNRTFLKSKLLHILTGYKLKRREDYQIGVYIGYADRDYTFSCIKLREFIEDELELSTYVYHRDADPSSSMANSIMFATSSSWRIVLVISENFLFNDEWSMFTVSSAIYGLSPDNPARVVVLVHEDLWHRLPDEVLNAVSEENIIGVPSWEMSYDLREKLRTRLK